jgi:dipeptidyl aminopeptidase/acylaminoacyl peptidase
MKNSGTSEAPYGSWKSPITSDAIVATTIGVGGTSFDGEDIYWLENRPQEGGRAVIVRLAPDGRREDVNPPPFNARSRVHEYGGGAYTVKDGVVYFTNFVDQRIYRQRVGSRMPEPMTPESKEASIRYTDLAVAPRGTWLVSVREEHGAGGREPVNTLVSVDVGDVSERHPGMVIAEGHDFYASPRFDADGSHLTWISWDHPNMPWDGSELWVAEVGARGDLIDAKRVAGGRAESIFQPEWSPDGVLYFISDRTGWWNLCRLEDSRVEAICPREAEFGLPQWVFGLRTYDFLSPTTIVCTYQEGDRTHLARLAIDTGRLDPVETPHTEIEGIRVHGEHALYQGGAPDRQTELVRIDLATGETEALRRSSTLEIEEAFLSIPEPLEFLTENGLTAHAFFYPPKNDRFRAPDGEKPPLLVLSHGGPTSATDTTLSPSVQYWTSRGIAVVDVNYGGSTGYGRAYRERLNGEWGVVDVDDSVHAAKHLIDAGRVDPGRIAIRGGSAGGYTTLAALTFRDLFKAGASYYGICDLEVLARDTHKFESRYLDSLIGPYPQTIDLYKSRSPIHFVDRLSCPIIFFQGLDDKVVPPNQAELMFEAVRKAGFPTAYLTFEGEGHGFRKAENIKRALDGELYFYGKVFGFSPADAIEPMRIENLSVREA